MRTDPTTRTEGRTINVPELYRLVARIPGVTDRQHLLRPGIVLDGDRPVPSYDWRALIDGYGTSTREDAAYAVDYVLRELFGPDDVVAIRAFIARRHRGATIDAEREVFPIPADRHATDADGYGATYDPATGAIRWGDLGQNYYREAGFDCPVPFYGYWTVAEWDRDADLAERRS